jgi:hypothetical protein
MTQQVAHAKIKFPDGATFEDLVTMTMTWEATGANTSLGLSSVNTAIHNFFNSLASGQTHPIAYYIGPNVSRAANAITTEWTDVTAHLDGSPAGSPYSTDTWTLGAGGPQAGLPPQLAACVGIRGAYGTDIEHGPVVTLPTDDRAIDEGAGATHLGASRPRARDRGRFYVGPLTIQTLDTVAGGSAGVGAFAALFLTDMAAALHPFLGVIDSGMADQSQMVQWSRRNASVHLVEFFFVDEGVATQRRRQDTTLNRVHTWVAV